MRIKTKHNMKYRYKRNRNSNSISNVMTTTLGFHLWYYEEMGMFLPSFIIGAERSLFLECKCVRKFRRKLRKMSGFVQSGYRFLLVGRLKFPSSSGKIR